MSSDDSILVSVVIPTYNHAQFLTKAVQSVFNQTYKNWEIIIIDNYSQDDTAKIVLEFKDPRVTFLQVKNSGVIAISRNMGILKAKGEWIAFLDSDDLWYPRKLEIVMRERKKNPSIDIFSTDEMLINNTIGFEKLLQYGPYCPDFYKNLLVKGNCLSPSATLVSRHFLIKNNIYFREDADFVTAEDYDLWMILAKAGAKFKFIHSVQGEFLIHQNNNSSQTEFHTQSIKNVIKDHVYNIQQFEPKKDKLWSYINARLLMVKAKESIFKKKFIEGVRCILEAFYTSSSGSLSYCFSRMIKIIKKKRIIKKIL